LIANQHLGELATPLETQGSGVLSPALRRQAVLQNLYGNAFNDGTVLVGALTSAAVGDKLVVVPNVASGGVLAVHTTQTLTHSIRIKSVDGTLYYVMLTNVTTNRTGGA
jgi:hypothetical protein